MRWYITAAITSTKTIKILSNIHSIEAAQCFSLNLKLPWRGFLFVRAGGELGAIPPPLGLAPGPRALNAWVENI